MKKETVKESSVEIVDALKCVLEAQFGERSKNSCVPALKKPVKRFCDIARKTEKRFKKEDPEYDISRFLGYGPRDMKKMGVVCSSKMDFPKCKEAIKAMNRASESFKSESYAEYRKKLDVAYAKNYSCQKEIVKEIGKSPIEKSQDYRKLLDSYETMRDWMHLSGYMLPDYVWVVPKNMRTKVKKLFEDLASERITAVKDLERKKDEIRSW